MLRFLKKHRKPFNKPVPPDGPARQTADIGAEHGRDSKGGYRSRKVSADKVDGTDSTMAPDTNHRGDSRIANQDRRVGDQQLPTQNVSTLTPRQGGGDATLQGHDHTMHRGSTEARNEQLRDPNTSPDLHFAEGDSEIHNQNDRESRGPGVQQPSEAAPECASSSGQDGGGANDPVQPERSKAKERGRVDRVLGRAAFAVELAKGPAEAFTPLKAVLASISGIYAQYQNTAAVKDKIEVLHSRIVILEKLFEQPASGEKETKHRKKLLIKLKDIKDRLLSLYEKPARLRIIDNVQDGEDVSGLLEDLQEAVNDYMMKQQMAIYDQGCILMDAVEKSALNNFRCARGAGYQHGGRKGCLKGTRGTVLSVIELWARDLDRSPIYWLNGLAGTGKSTIAKTIAERLFADGQLGASFFCSRDFEDRRNLQMIFPTLAVQLARRYIKFRSILVSLIQSDPDIAYESLYDQMKKLIAKPLIESKISTVIVIDALDECEDEEPASAILSVLGQLVPKIPKVKFFLTGRPESRISEGFRLPLLAKMTDVFVLHEVELDQVDSDIRLFFKTSFSELVDRRRALDSWPTEEQLDQLCGRAAGLFVYAAATIKFIDTNRRDPKKQLDLLLQSQKIGDHEGKSLDSLYTSILRDAFGDDRPEDDAKTRSILGAVILAANPLSPSTIAVLLGFDAEDVSFFLSSANSLLILKEDVNRPVRPFHKSFPDFITDPNRCTNARFHISPPDHHAQLLIGCLGLMDRTLEKNMCKLPDGVANSDVSDLKERAEEFIDPALQYACVSWHTHLVGLVDANIIPAHVPTITPAIRRFLETKFLFWLEVLSILGAARNAVEALQVAADWLEESPTFDLANDCFRFVTGSLEVINASSQHIYHSALVVAPRNSIVRKLYEAHAHPLTRIACGAPISWEANTAVTARPFLITLTVWSPCDRFIAITCGQPVTVDVLDSATLQRLQTLEFPQGISPVSDVLVFSPDSRVLSSSSYANTNPSDPELVVISWDLQTGGVASVIRWQMPAQPHTYRPNMAYLASGKVVGVYRESEDWKIFICDVASGVLAHSHSPKNTGWLKNTIWLNNLIWAHGESIRFVTADATTITIWEVGITSGATPTEVETLPTPDRFGDEGYVAQFLPGPCRIALYHGNRDRTRGRILVWDARRSKSLLEWTDADFRPRMSFSSDGRFFACATMGPDVYLWKDSPDGYILHGILASSTRSSIPVLTQNGESIVVFGSRAIQLWHTKSLITIPSSISIRAFQDTEDFILEFSPDGMFAVAAREGGNTVIVHNLKSGTPQLTIDPGMEVYALGVIEDTVVAIGSRKVIGWKVPAGDCVPNGLVGLEDRSWTISLCGSQDYARWIRASISPDSRYIAVVEDYSLHIHRTSTGEHLGRTSAGLWTPRFSWDGRNVWCADFERIEGAWRVGGGREVLERLWSVDDTGHPPKGNPWDSSRGYQVTNDRWILGPGGKRLLMVPPLWQPYVRGRLWKEQFLALLDGGLSEPVILDLDVNRGL